MVLFLPCFVRKRHPTALIHFIGNGGHCMPNWVLGDFENTLGLPYIPIWVKIKLKLAQLGMPFRTHIGEFYQPGYVTEVLPCKKHASHYGEESKLQTHFSREPCVHEFYGWYKKCSIFNSLQNWIGVWTRENASFRSYSRKTRFLTVFHDYIYHACIFKFFKTTSFCLQTIGYPTKKPQVNS